MTAAAPGMHRETNPAHNIARGILATGMPLLFPTHQVGGNAQLLTIGALPFLVHQIDALEKELKGVHVEFRGKVIKSTHRNDCRLGVVGSSPGACRADVVADCDVLLPLVGNAAKYVGNWWHTPAAR